MSKTESHSLLGIAAFVGAVLAAALAHGASVIPLDRTVVYLGSYLNGAYAGFSPAMPGVEGCSYAPGNQVWIDWQSDPNGKTLYATLLAAYHAGHKVGFAVNGCTSSGLPIVYRVDVSPT